MKINWRQKIDWEKPWHSLSSLLHFPVNSIPFKLFYLILFSPSRFFSSLFFILSLQNVNSPNLSYEYLLAHLKNYKIVVKARGKINIPFHFINRSKTKRNHLNVNTVEGEREKDEILGPFRLSNF